MCTTKNKIKATVERVKRRLRELKRKEKNKAIKPLPVVEIPVKPVAQSGWDENAIRVMIRENKGVFPLLKEGEERTEDNNPFSKKNFKLLEEYFAEEKEKNQKKKPRNTLKRNNYNALKPKKKIYTNNKVKFNLWKVRKQIKKEELKKKKLEYEKRKYNRLKYKLLNKKKTNFRKKKGIFFHLKEALRKKNYIYLLFKTLINISILYENKMFTYINRIFNKIYYYIYFSKYIKYSRILSYILKYYIKIKQNIRYIFYKISGSYLTPNVILNYLIIQLKKRFNLFEVINPLIITLLRYTYNLVGFKLMCCGRFTRKQIATYYWNLKGKISSSTTTSLIDYSQGIVILKNSLCGIKIWLSYKDDFQEGILKNKKFLYYYE